MNVCTFFLYVIVAVVTAKTIQKEEVLQKRLHPELEPGEVWLEIEGFDDFGTLEELNSLLEAGVVNENDISITFDHEALLESVILLSANRGIIPGESMGESGAELENEDTAPIHSLVNNEGADLGKIIESRKHEVINKSTKYGVTSSSGHPNDVPLEVFGDTCTPGIGAWGGELIPTDETCHDQRCCRDKCAMIRECVYYSWIVGTGGGQGCRVYPADDEKRDNTVWTYCEFPDLLLCWKDGDPLESQIGTVLGSSSHTVSMGVTLPISLPSPRHWMLIIGDSTSGNVHWLLHDTTSQFGEWGSSAEQLQFSEANFSGYLGMFTVLTCTMDAWVQKYCCYANSDLLGCAFNVVFNIQSDSVSIKTAINNETPFNGFVEWVAISSRVIPPWTMDTLDHPCKLLLCWENGDPLSTQIGTVLGSSSHTISMRVTLPTTLPLPRQWLLIVGDSADGNLHWLPAHYTSQFGEWNGEQVQFSSADISDHLGKSTVLTCTMDSRAMRYCCYANTDLIGCVHEAGFNIQSDYVKIKTPLSTEPAFNGLVEWVAISSGVNPPSSMDSLKHPCMDCNFFDEVPGRSPGSNVGLIQNVASISDCKALCCEHGPGCIAIGYWASGDCYKFDRTYNENHASGGDVHVANRIPSCWDQRSNKNAIQGVGSYTDWPQFPTEFDCILHCENTNCYIYIWHSQSSGTWAYRCVTWSFFEAQNAGKLNPNSWLDSTNEVSAINLCSPLTCQCQNEEFYIGQEVVATVDIVSGSQYPTITKGSAGWIVCGSSQLDTMFVQWHSLEENEDGQTGVDCLCGNALDTATGGYASCNKLMPTELPCACSSEFFYGQEVVARGSPIIHPDGTTLPEDDHGWVVCGTASGAVFVDWDSLSSGSNGVSECAGGCGATSLPTATGVSVACDEIRQTDVDAIECVCDNNFRVGDEVVAVREYTFQSRTIPGGDIGYVVCGINGDLFIDWSSLQDNENGFHGSNCRDGCGLAGLEHDTGNWASCDQVRLSTDWIVTDDGCPTTPETRSHCTNPTTKDYAVVRCCSMDGSSCDSDPGGVDICSGFVTFKEALVFCQSYNMRLCTANELAEQMCCDTGCQYNLYRTWTEDKCHQSYQTTDGCTTSVVPDFETACTLQTNNNLAHARCCNDGGIDCETEFWFESCSGLVTYEKAVKFCGDQDMRLCELSELESGICCGSGCGYDGVRTWTQSSCEGDRRYVYVPSSDTWDNQRTFCETMGGSLASITTVTENKEVNTLCGSNDCYIGLHFTGGVWRWTDGTEPTYWNWVSQTGYSLTFMGQSDGKWRDGDGTTLLPAVCSYIAHPDIDQCLFQLDDCDSLATCSNTDESYDCTCNDGYEGSGFTCTDIDECANPDDNDCDPNSSCVNTDGAYICPCNTGFLGDGLEKCHIPVNDLFKWSSAGSISGMYCAHIYESVDPHSWHDNYFCSSYAGTGFQFGAAGPIAGKTCVNTDEVTDPHTWNDNYFCANDDFNYTMSWSSAGCSGYGCDWCVRWVETGDPYTWNDNYLCFEPNYCIGSSNCDSDPFDCTDWACPPWKGGCEKTILPSGEGCTNSVGVDGICVGEDCDVCANANCGAPLCKDPVCDPDYATCSTVNQINAPCDDGDTDTYADRCFGGVCSGYDCAVDAIPKTCDLIKHAIDFVDGYTRVLQSVECIRPVFEEVIVLKEKNEKLKKNIEKVHSRLPTVENILGILSMLPYIGGFCKTSKNVVHQFYLRLDDVLDATDKLNKTLTPMAKVSEQILNLWDLLLYAANKAPEVLEDLEAGTAHVLTNCVGEKYAMETVADAVPKSQDTVNALNDAATTMEPVCATYTPVFNLLIAANLPDIINLADAVAMQIANIFDGVLGQVLDALQAIFDMKFCYRIKTIFGNDKICYSLQRFMDDFNKLVKKIMGALEKVIDGILSNLGLNLSWLDFSTWLSIPGVPFTVPSISIPSISFDISFPTVPYIDLSIDWTEINCPYP